jgi:hypothetical protein
MSSVGIPYDTASSGGDVFYRSRMGYSPYAVYQEVLFFCIFLFFFFFVIVILLFFIYYFCCSFIIIFCYFSMAYHYGNIYDRDREREEGRRKRLSKKKEHYFMLGHCRCLLRLPWRLSFLLTIIF